MKFGWGLISISWYRMHNVLQPEKADKQEPQRPATTEEHLTPATGACLRAAPGISSQDRASRAGSEESLQQIGRGATAAGEAIEGFKMTPRKGSARAQARCDA